MDQVFGVTHVYEKYPANGKDEICAFIDLENLFDTIYRHGKV